MLFGLNKPNTALINHFGKMQRFEFIIIVRPKTFILKIKKYFVKECELFFSDKIFPKLKSI